jgi:hypothetical protein
MGPPPSTLHASILRPISYILHPYTPTPPPPHTPTPPPPPPPPPPHTPPPPHPPPPLHPYTPTPLHPYTPTPLPVHPYTLRFLLDTVYLPLHREAEKHIT